MAKYYMFDKDNLIQLMLNHKTFISQLCQKQMAQGLDVRFVTVGQTYRWTEEWFMREVENTLPFEDIQKFTPEQQAQVDRQFDEIFKDKLKKQQSTTKV